MAFEVTSICAEQCRLLGRNIQSEQTLTSSSETSKPSNRASALCTFGPS